MTKFRWIRLLLFVFLTTSVLAQVPDKFTNLKVLPKDISKDVLIEKMKGFTGPWGFAVPPVTSVKKGSP